MIGESNYISRAFIQLIIFIWCMWYYISRVRYWYPIRSRDGEGHVDSNRLEWLSREKRDERGRGRRTKEGTVAAGGRSTREGGPGTMGPVYGLRVSVTARSYCLTRNTTPEEAHEHTHIHTVWMCERVSLKWERGRGPKEPEGLKPATG